MSHDIRTKRRTLGQVLVCLGCCCGRTDKGKPAVPTDWLKSEWKRRGLLKHVHLSISGCLGPCEIANVVAIVTPDDTHWYGGLDGDHYYAALLAWAEVSAARGSLAPLPAVLEPFRFSRFVRPGQLVDTVA